jgi:hypothetical protein
MMETRNHALFTFRISSLLLIIAVVAVCLAAWQLQPYVGIEVAVVVLPALGYTCVVAFKSASAGKPMLVSDKVHMFWIALLGVVVIEFASLVAFCMTCVPTGYIALAVGGLEPGLIVACVVGGLAAIAAGGWVTYFLLTRKRRLARKAGEP